MSNITIIVAAAALSVLYVVGVFVFQLVRRPAKPRASTEQEREFLRTHGAEMRADLERIGLSLWLEDSQPRGFWEEWDKYWSTWAEEEVAELPHGIPTPPQAALLDGVRQRLDGLKGGSK